MNSRTRNSNSNSPDRISSPETTVRDSKNLHSISSNVSSRPDPVNEYWLNTYLNQNNNTINQNFLHSHSITKTQIPSGWRYLRHNDGYRERKKHTRVFHILNLSLFELFY